MSSSSEGRIRVHAKEYTWARTHTKSSSAHTCMHRWLKFPDTHTRMHTRTSRHTHSYIHLFLLVRFPASDGILGFNCGEIRARHTLRTTRTEGREHSIARCMLASDCWLVKCYYGNLRRKERCTCTCTHTRTCMIAGARPSTCMLTKARRKNMDGLQQVGMYQNKFAHKRTTQTVDSLV
jgi:hypothetical protein